MNEDALDTMLSAPLEDVADDGFSARVALRIDAAETRRIWFAWAGPALAACAVAPFLPLQEFSDTMMRLAPALAGSAPVAFAAGVLILTFSLDQRLRE